jgi:HD-GYP domain-containing protein (c-di-GMP phosphodiesterase class II)
VRLVGLSYIKPGSVLARDVLAGTNGTIPLLRRGVVLTHDFIDRLEAAGIYTIYVDDEFSEGIEVTPLISEKTRRLAADSLGKVFKEIRKGNSAAQPLDEATVSEITAVVRLIAGAIADSRDAVVAIQSLAAASAYTVQHSINVTAIGLLLGERCLHDHGWVDYREMRRLDGAQEQLVQLGLGLMLHDIGKSLIPKSILDKPAALDEEEQALMRFHPLYGVEMLSPVSTSARVRAVVRSHHERWDGSGYPDGKIAKTAHQFARIAAIADVYDAVTSERPYSRAAPPELGWNLIVDQAGAAFDPEIVDIFRQVVAPYPPGHEITLDDGRRGVVVSVHPYGVEHPHVRICWDADGTEITPYEIDLIELPSNSVSV